jgi:hypothetical protein
MTEVQDLEFENDDSIRQAMSLIDQGLGEISERQLVSTSEVADLLLDVRTVLSRLDPEVSPN